MIYGCSLNSRGLSRSAVILKETSMQPEPLGHIQDWELNALILARETGRDAEA